MQLSMLEHTPKFPAINYIGNKNKIADWICNQIPDGSASFFDAFSGGCSVSFEAKKRGLKVISNDILKVNEQLAKALIENNSEILSKEDVDGIFEGKPVKGFVYKNYRNKLFFDDECMQLDQYRNNIDKLGSEYKKALVYSLMRRAMIRKMPYSRFNIEWEKVKQLRDEEYSYEKYKRRRAYHNKSFEYHFRHSLDKYNAAVFDNGKKNTALSEDIFTAIKKVKADVIYLDPPYSGTMNDYHGFYGFLDSYIAQKIMKPFTNNFMDKKSALELFDTLFANLGNYKYWILSYNSSSYPTKDELLEIIYKYAGSVTVIERKHVYKITGKVKKHSNVEYLFIAKRK